MSESVPISYDAPSTEPTFNFNVLSVAVYDSPYHTDIVKLVTWSLTYVDGEYRAAHTGSIGFDYSEDAPIQNFVRLSELTTSMVSAWIDANSEKTLAQWKDWLVAQVAEQKKLRVIELVLAP